MKAAPESKGRLVVCLCIVVVAAALAVYFWFFRGGPDAQERQRTAELRAAEQGQPTSPPAADMPVDTRPARGRPVAPK